MRRKVKSMKFSNIIEFQKTDYSYLELIVTKSNKCQNTEQIMILINKLYKKTSKYIKCIKNHLIIEQMPKLGFYIHMQQDKIQFFFMLPKCVEGQFRMKFKDIWRNIEIKSVDSLPIDIENSSKFDMHYKYNDSLSLATNKRAANLLKSNLQITSLLKEEENVGVFYNFIPTSQRESQYFQNKTYKDNLEKFKAGANLKKVKNLKDYSFIALKLTLDIIDIVLQPLIGVKSDKKKQLGVSKPVSNNTDKKGKSDLCKNQIIIFTKANNKEREMELAQSFANTYKVVKDNNDLVINKITKSIDIKRTIISNVKVNKCSISENNCFIDLPSTEIIKQFSTIKHNKVLELPAPSSLSQGEIRIGDIKCKEDSYCTYYSMDKELKRLGRILFGPMGSGKTHYLINMSDDIIKANRGLVVLDYIQNCQLSSAIKEITPPEKLIEINFNDPKCIQSFNFNELNFEMSDDIYYKVNVAMQKAEQMQILLDSINSEEGKLSPRMLRYLYCSATTVYFLDPYASFREIINVMKYPEARDRVLGQLSVEAKEILFDEIEDLKDLNKVDKKGNVENYDSKIDGILDRIAWLKSTNLYTKLAFNKGAKNNINFVEELKQNKVILVKLPEKDFKSRMIRNVIATFFLNKVWLAKQCDNTTQTELFIDEIHQCPNCQLLMQDILVECRKFNLTPTLALHNLDQLTQKCRSSVLSSSSSFILLQGCDLSVFNMKGLAQYFNNAGYTEVDLSELKRYHALCLIKCEEGYRSFIVKLPK